MKEKPNTVAPGQTVTIKRCPQCGLRYETADPWQKFCTEDCLSRYIADLSDSLGSASEDA